MPPLISRTPECENAPVHSISPLSISISPPDCKSMDEAVNAAYKISSSGDCVLLSPACASFDLFDDFEDRGRQFKTAVRKL